MYLYRGKQTLLLNKRIKKYWIQVKTILDFKGLDIACQNKSYLKKEKEFNTSHNIILYSNHCLLACNRQKKVWKYIGKPYAQLSICEENLPSIYLRGKIEKMRLKGTLFLPHTPNKANNKFSSCYTEHFWWIIRAFTLDSCFEMWHEGNKRLISLLFLKTFFRFILWTSSL